ncbi:hypothetical protein KFE96_06680 [Kordiimonas sp. SCSIO 12603]|uniref:hypothetical protein n=1 Tax=Kordiimonas sp. SCSIO 12603 TaxID=2829596 RepID=UPI002102DB92|nr:hypothetical protein [Kordiimonas sp. SCSIO 12603]UTW59986.1 hypothetical protein KFE96_06680 [Kordiimonas sp. SCSIO 12603]
MNANTMTGPNEIVIFHRKKRHYQLALAGLVIAAAFSAEKILNGSFMALEIMAGVVLVLAILGIIRVSAALLSSTPYIRLTDDALVINELFSTKTIPWSDISMINAPSDDCTGVSCLKITYGKGKCVKLAIDELIADGRRPACMIHHRWDEASQHG